jgi:membrane-associated phospholipid phosphatase
MINTKYSLKGLQVEPEASLWLDDKSYIRVPSLKDITHFSERKPLPNDRLALDFPKDFPFDTSGNDTSEFDRQLKILSGLQSKRLVSPYPKSVPLPDGRGTFKLTPLSRFLQLQPVPFGAIFDISKPVQDIIQNVLEQHRRILTTIKVVNQGSELARMFENETPGLYHRHALNWALFNRADVSPPRQARIWMALDVTIYAALGAAWHYKWLRDKYSRLLRPEEYDTQANNKLDVLYDRMVTNVGSEGGNLKTCPKPTPGTPRHPAWPSGHSTYSAACSHILEYFFSPGTLETPDEELFKDFPPGDKKITEQGWIAAELRRLANNIGEARLWAGVHWYSDHIAGQKIGRSAAQTVIEQLEKDCVPDFMIKQCNSTDKPPTNAQIEKDAMRNGPCKPNQDEIEQRPNRGESFLRKFGGF